MKKIVLPILITSFLVAATNTQTVENSFRQDFQKQVNNLQKIIQNYDNNYLKNKIIQSKKYFNFNDFKTIENRYNYKYKMFFAGIPKENISIKLIKNKYLKIKGKNKINNKNTDEINTSEYNYNYQITLPKNIILNNIKAHLDKGILTIIVNKDLKKIKKDKNIINIPIF